MKARKKPVVIETVIFLGFYGKDRNFSERPKWWREQSMLIKKLNFLMFLKN